MSVPDTTIGTGKGRSRFIILVSALHRKRLPNGIPKFHTCKLLQNGRPPFGIFGRETRTTTWTVRNFSSTRHFGFDGEAVEAAKLTNTGHSLERKGCYQSSRHFIALPCPCLGKEENLPRKANERLRGQNNTCTFLFGSSTSNKQTGILAVYT